MYSNITTLSITINERIFSPTTLIWAYTTSTNHLLHLAKSPKSWRAWFVNAASFVRKIKHSYISSHFLHPENVYKQRKYYIDHLIQCTSQNNHKHPKQTLPVCAYFLFCGIIYNGECVKTKKNHRKHAARALLYAIRFGINIPKGGAFRPAFLRYPGAFYHW